MAIMKTWIDRILLLVVLAVVIVLSATAAAWLAGGRLQGSMLRLHMMASGVLVITLPLFALSSLWRNISRVDSGGLQKLGFWSLVVTGLATIATVFACMLPIPSTDQMHSLILLHGYAGFAMVPALALLLLGTSRWRRIQSTRSATPG